MAETWVKSWAPPDGTDVLCGLGRVDARWADVTLPWTAAAGRLPQTATHV
ncbi:hypothetical protein AAU01_39790 [Paenarthrobacter aurescens]|uniref:Uncharacterized protein n=1 Tax=Paenarthrobacter aurescens TaxID=43663 RepID=A0A4Y3NGS3_PAEAU|nr:hypothetical protein AAU01_39790 [Paenarthrobacter aurescens]